jgi:hypothetical protein
MADEPTIVVPDTIPAPTHEWVRGVRPYFYVTVVDDMGEYYVKEFENLDELVSKVKGFVNSDVSIFAFHGIRLHVSKPPARYLVTPWGNKPLFETNATLEIDETGYLGNDPIHLAPPATIKVPTANAETEGVFDDPDDVLGAFDSVLPDPDE